MLRHALIAAVVFTVACNSNSESVSAGDAGSDTSVDTGLPEVAAESGTEASTPEVATDVGEEASAMGTLFGEPCGESTATATVFLPGLQYSGSVSWTRTTSSGKERVSMSAPIHPSIDKLYEGEGDFYPKTASLQQSLATHSALTPLGKKYGAVPSGAVTLAATVSSTVSTSAGGRSSLLTICTPYSGWLVLSLGTSTAPRMA